MNKKAVYIFVTLMVFILFLPAYAQRTSGQFALMDKNGDGKVTFSELQSLHPNMGRDAFDKADTDNDGILTHDEWYHYRDKPGMGRNTNTGYSRGDAPGNSRPGKSSQTQFAEMDRNNDRLLSFEEVRGQVRDADRKAFENADSDHDGFLNHSEWVAAKEQFGFGVRSGVGSGRNR